MRGLRAAVGSILAVILLTGAEPADRYQLHFTGVSCVIGPCPQWLVTNQRSGEQFDAVVDFSAVGARPPGLDLIAEAWTKDMPRSDGRTYPLLTVIRIIEHQ